MRLFHVWRVRQRLEVINSLIFPDFGGFLAYLSATTVASVVRGNAPDRAVKPSKTGLFSFLMTRVLGSWSRYRQLLRVAVRMRGGSLVHRFSTGL
jgi:hypothetical protein